MSLSLRLRVLGSPPDPSRAPARGGGSDTVLGVASRCRQELPGKRIGVARAAGPLLGRPARTSGVPDQRAAYSAWPRNAPARFGTADFGWQS